MVTKAIEEGVNVVATDTVTLLDSSLVVEHKQERQNADSCQKISYIDGAAL